MRLSGYVLGTIVLCCGNALAQDAPAKAPNVFDLPRDGTASAEAPAVPRLVENGIALVSTDNTTWDAKQSVFRTAFRWADDDPRKTAAAVEGHDKAGELIRQWQKEGTACGLFGVLYDNHDRDHSNLPVGQFPQLTAVEYGEEAKAKVLDHGMQLSFLFGQPTFGNSSTALTAGPFWRSQTRLAQTNARAVGLQYQQYVNNHLYFYPEHRDYDPGHNGPGDGFGDVYPANTPYVITSQGSSGSDQPFLHAVACTLAAFQPATRDKLIETNLLMPTVQMVFRRSNKQVAAEADYLTGKAHPPVFQGEQLDVERMVRLAHEIKPGELPPLVQLQVVQEDQPVAGVDYFDAATSETLFDTPCAIARVHRTTASERKMIVTAATSYDVSDRPLQFRWALLQGLADRVQIKPLKDDNSLAEIRVRWHQRFPVQAGSKMETNRIDIGVFAHNGVHYSAPAFVTLYCLDSETRKYDDAGRIQSVEYRSQAAGGNYADPAIHTPRDWRDEYQYDEAGKLAGWTRIRGEMREEFTALGHLVVERDERSRPAKVRKVRYEANRKGGQAPRLEQVAATEVLTITYDGPTDRVGKLSETPPAP
jgi:YD repeat-containing protein